MSLREYKRKRNFRRTAEPAGRVDSSATGRQFVVQKHDASRLHYDFRLELDGTLKSWAVPKGPSLDPKVKALAVQVEDHPLDYADFEGVIPAGEYGGGTVMVWDRGQWEPEVDPARGLRSGKLKFRLEGEKLHGSWALVRMGGRAGDDGKNWLLIKHDDEAARSTLRYDVTKREPLSVVSERELPEIAAAAERVWSSTGSEKRRKQTSDKPAPSTTSKQSRMEKKEKGRGRVKSGSLDFAKVPGARHASQPTALSPHLATLAADIPTGDGWLHELKFDGYRILAFVKKGRVRLITRNGKDWTRRFPTIAARIAELPVEQAILDGEIVSLDDEGISNFQQLQKSLKRGDDDALVYYVFDLPHAGGYDLTATPLEERKSLLSRLLLTGNAQNAGVVRYSDHVAGQGDAVVEQACRSGMEGIVAKRVDAPYEQTRSRTWLKVKCSRRQEFVIGGYTKPSGGRVGLGALLLGYYSDGEFTYAGRVGTGFSDETLRQLKTELRARRSPKPPFSTPLSAAERRGATWVRPELVAEIEFTEWTSEGLLRHPSFKGLREDKSPRQISREEAIAMPRASYQTGSAAVAAKDAVKKVAKSDSRNASVGGVTVTHPDRVLYPEMGLTKLGLARYYESIADWILPHVANRPLTLVRCPDGRGGQCFYQKHLSHALPEGVRTVRIKEKDSAGEYVVVQDLAGLVSLVQMGVLELHPWPARADKLESPDRIVIDLDPGAGATWQAVVTAAREVRERLDELGLTAFLRTSGGKGLHVVAPLSRRNTWEQLKTFAKALADEMVRRSPERYTATLSKAKRRGKLFIDYLRNQRGATAIASYSTRAREGAPVAAPLSWDELSLRLKPNGYTVANLPRRLAKLKSDPWDGFFALRQSITREMQAAVEG